MALCRSDKGDEERVGSERAGFKLRMKLASEEPRMIGKLDDLDKPGLLIDAAHNKAMALKLLHIPVVDLIAVTVAL